jgi:uncharacterized protein YidB (DUF937 family)
MNILKNLLHIAGLSETKEKEDLSIISHWIEEQGGVSVILKHMHDGELTDLYTAWISDKESFTVSKDLLCSIFPQSALDELENRLGLNANQVYELLITYLPVIMGKAAATDETLTDKN